MKSVSSWYRYCWLILLLLPGVALSAAPGGLSVSPVRVDIASTQAAAAITVTNSGDAEKIIQVDPLQWSRAYAVDEYSPTRELVVNPPMFRLAPGGAQIVRVGLARLARPDAQAEKTFRVFFQELPSSAYSGDSQLRILLRIGVPVFVAPQQQGAVSDLRWKLLRNEAGQVVLRVRNAGGLHERISQLALYAPADDAPVARIDGFSYVLPGESRDWLLSPQPVSVDTGLRLRAVTEAGNVRAEVPPP